MERKVHVKRTQTYRSWGTFFVKEVANVWGGNFEWSSWNPNETCSKYLKPARMNVRKKTMHKPCRSKKCSIDPHSSSLPDARYAPHRWRHMSPDENLTSLHVSRKWYSTAFDIAIHLCHQGVIMWSFKFPSDWRFIFSYLQSFTVLNAHELCHLNRVSCFAPSFSI